MRRPVAVSSGGRLRVARPARSQTGVGSCQRAPRRSKAAMLAACAIGQRRGRMLATTPDRQAVVSSPASGRSSRRRRQAVEARWHDRLCTGALGVWIVDSRRKALRPELHGPHRHPTRRRRSSVRRLRVDEAGRRLAGRAGVARQGPAVQAGRRSPRRDVLDAAGKPTAVTVWNRTRVEQHREVDRRISHGWVSPLDRVGGAVLAQASDRAAQDSTRRAHRRQQAEKAKTLAPLHARRRGARHQSTIRRRSSRRRPASIRSSAASTAAAASRSAPATASSPATGRNGTSPACTR